MVGPPGSQVSVDGVPASGNGQLDTSYLTNGQHTLSVNSNGKTTTETINVQNHLNPFQNLRNFLFAHITQNHLLMNAGTVSLLLLPPILLLVIFRTRIVGLLGHIRKPVTL